MSEQDARSEAIEAAVDAMTVAFHTCKDLAFGARMEAALAALLEPRTEVCPACQGKKWVCTIPDDEAAHEHNRCNHDAGRCPSCNGSGTVSLPALATLNAELEQVGCLGAEPNPRLVTDWNVIRYFEGKGTPLTPLYRLPPMTEQEN